MNFDIEEAMAVLWRTPATLKSLLSGLPKGWVRNADGPDTWSPYDIVGHLIHGERTDWMERARIILEFGESRSFEPFDRFAQFEASEGKTLEALLEEFSELRQKNLADLREMHLSHVDLAKKGIHPELGVVTLGELLSTWVAHDLGHLGQITRTMARQYGGEVGPWRAYLSVLAD